MQLVVLFNRKPLLHRWIFKNAYQSINSLPFAGITGIDQGLSVDAVCQKRSSQPLPVENKKRITYNQCILNPHCIRKDRDPGCHHVTGAGRIVEKQATRAEMLTDNVKKICGEQISAVVAPKVGSIRYDDVEPCIPVAQQPSAAIVDHNLHSGIV